MTYIMDGPYHLCHLFTPPLEANQVKPSHGLHLSNRDIWKKQGCLHHHTTQAWPFDTTWEVNLTYVVGIWNRMEGKGTHWVGPIGWSRKSLANGQPWTKRGGKKTIGMEHYDLIL